MAPKFKNKVATLSPDTHRIASSMENFSGWLRARLRQFDEGVDLVEVEMAKNYMRLQYKNLSFIINENLELEEQDLVWTEFNKLMNQKKLEDFQ